MACMMVSMLWCAFGGAPDVSPITNHYVEGMARPRLEAEQAWLYQPEAEWTYSHHPSLTFFQGRYYAMWSNGRQDEDALGQRVLLSRSEDFAAWEPPRPLIGPRQGEQIEVTLTAAGFHVFEDTLVAYFGQYEYEAAPGGQRPDGDRNHRNTSLWAMTTRDGETWSEPVNLGVPVVPNHPPTPTRSGRLVICGNISFPYSDAPSGLGPWTMTGIYPPEMAPTLFDDSEGFWRVKERMGWPVGLCEGSFYQTDDGLLHMLLRSGTEYLWVTESADDGATWSAPCPTRFTDNGTKFHFGRLPDGRFYGVGNPDPQPRGARNPLVLALSRDGLSFDRHYILADAPHAMKRPGRYKGGLYGYPHSLVHDEWLSVIVSVNKEGVLALRVPLAALGQ